MTSDINRAKRVKYIAPSIASFTPFIVGVGAIVMAFVVNVEMAWIFVIAVADFSSRRIGVIYWTI